MQKPRPSLFTPLLLLVMATLLIPAASDAQSNRGSLTGVITDSSGAVVSDAEMVLRNEASGREIQRTSANDGGYAFLQLVAGKYELQVVVGGFEPYIRPGIEVSMARHVRIDVSLALGGQTEVVEVTASSLTFNTGSRAGSIQPEAVDTLPLLLDGAVRTSAGFAVLMPGISTGGQGNPFDARINGGQASGDEAVLDGVSMQQGHMSQSGMVSILLDFPFSPDMVSEVKVVTSSYEPQYGASTSGQITAITKSGGDAFHGAVFEYFRNDSLNATQWGVTEKPTNEQHNFGGNIGGPMKIPGLWSDNVKTYFYVNLEGFRIEGGVNRPTVSIPSLRQRNGDFSDWVDANGNLIPIYDPATTQVLPDGSITRQPFPGNIIPADRISPLAQEFLQFLPNPTREGALNNFTGEPIPDSILADTNYYFGRFDSYVGDNDHFSISIWHQRAPVKFNCIMPQELCENSLSEPQDSWVNRANWNHTFGPNLLNNMAFGYLNRNEGYGAINARFADTLPQISGVVNHNTPPTFNFSDDFQGWGSGAGIPEGNITTRPTYVLNNLTTWVKGSHTFKFGFEYRNIGGNLHTNDNESGTFSFGRGATGLLDINSGSPIASYLLEQVDNASMDVRAQPNTFVRQNAWIFHVGDTWRANNKLTLNYGLRWDYFSPSKEKFDRSSFFDPDGANPGAGGLPGRLAFAGTEWGEASFGEPYTEKRWYGGFAPRLGATYAVDDRTVVRAGWGIFYDRQFYPGWGGGIGNAGFNSNVAFSSSAGGLQPAFILSQGFPQNFAAPPFINSAFRNGQDISPYRPLNANERPRSQQWNITVDREISPGFSGSLAYVGSRGRRLPSSVVPLNAIDPSLLSMGDLLFQEFQSDGQVIGGVSVPYAGWVDQMTGCPPNVAQALRPFPQYCNSLGGLNENQGESSYHSLQVKLEKRHSGGTYFLVAYTLGRLFTSAGDNIQAGATEWSGASGVISPFEQGRNRALAADDVTHVLSTAFIWDIPYAQGSTGAKKVLLDGWTFSTIFRYSSGVPFFYRSGFCNVPGQFRAGCIPAITGDPFAQDVGSFDPGAGPLFNAAGFQSVDTFNFNYGTGARVTDLRAPSYWNNDVAFMKNTHFGDRFNVQLRMDIFNIWNAHTFTTRGGIFAAPTAFTTDLASPDFGRWTGAVSNPRNIQFSARFQW